MPKPTLLPTLIPYTQEAQPALGTARAYDGFWARKAPWISDEGVVYDQRSGLGTNRPPQPRRSLVLNGVDQYGAYVLVDPIDIYPFTLFGWVNKTDVALDGLVGVGSSSDAAKYLTVLVDEGNRVQVSRRNTTAYDTQITTNGLSGQWRSVVVVFESNTAFSVYENGVLISSQTGLDSVLLDSGFDRFFIGALRTPSPTNYLDGKLMHCGYIRRAGTLSDAQTFHSTGIIPDADGLFLLDENSTTVSYNIGLDEGQLSLVNGTSAMRYTGQDVPFSRQNEVGYSDGASDVKLPIRLSDSLDVLGNSPDYTGKAHFDAQSEESACLSFDGVDDYIEIDLSLLTAGGLTGPELITNGTFDSDLSGWTPDASNATNFWEWSAGTARVVSDGTFASLRQPNVFEVGKAYEISVDVVATTGFVKMGTSGSATGINGLQNLSTGTHTVIFVAQGTDLFMGRQSGVTDVTVDNISVKELPVISNLGTSTLTYRSQADGITGTAGTAYGIQIGEVELIPCSEGAGSQVHGVKLNQAYNIVNGQASNWETTQNDYHYNLVNGFNLFELPLVPALSLSSSYQAVDQSGGTYSFQVLSNTDWSWSSDSPWVSSSEAVNQNGDQEFTYTVQENESAERTAIITVTTGGITVTHTITQTAGFLLLDNYTADFGYSLRKIRVGYTGPAIRVRRESDDAEQDIGFVGNDLDVSAIETFCSGTVGRVTTWYDQAGVKNATTTPVDTQPFIYVDGAVTRNEHGLPAIWLLDEDLAVRRSILYTPSWGLAESLWVAASAVYSLVKYGDNPTVLYGNNMRMLHNGTSGIPRLQVIKSSGSYFFGSGVLQKNTTYVRLDSYDRVTASIFFDKGTVAAASRADLDDDSPVNPSIIGPQVSSAITYVLLSELVTFTVEDSANSLAIRSDQYDYWTNGTTPTVLSLSDPSETFTEFAGTHSFNVTADATWSWSCDADWITSNEFVNQTGNKEFTYSVSTNEGEERTATITFTSGGLTATHTVTQSAPVPLLLDTYTGAVGFSLRKIRTDYTGPAVRIRRESDSAEQDIAFVAGELDTDTIETFCAGTVGRVTTWYDQVGSNNAVQTNTTLQPIIYESGAIPVNEYGRPAIRCLDNNPSGSTGRVTLPAFFTVDQPYVAYASVYSLLDSGNFPPIVASAPVERGLTVAHDGTTRIPIATAIRTSGSRSAGSGGTPLDLNTTTIRFDYADRTLVQIFLNTDIEDSGSAGADADVDFTALNPIDLGGRNATIVLNDTLLSEVIGFTVNQTANNLAIRTDQYNYWKAVV